MQFISGKDATLFGTDIGYGVASLEKMVKSMEHLLLRLRE